jgi:hypothetical protein
MRTARGCSGSGAATSTRTDHARDEHGPRDLVPRRRGVPGDVAGDDGADDAAVAHSDAGAIPPVPARRGRDPAAWTVGAGSGGLLRGVGGARRGRLHRRRGSHGGRSAVDDDRAVAASRGWGGAARGGLGAVHRLEGAAAGPLSRRRGLRPHDRADRTRRLTAWAGAGPALQPLLGQPDAGARRDWHDESGCDGRGDGRGLGRAAGAGAAPSRVGVGRGDRSAWSPDDFAGLASEPSASQRGRAPRLPGPAPGLPRPHLSSR